MENDRIMEEFILKELDNPNSKIYKKVASVINNERKLIENMIDLRVCNCLNVKSSISPYEYLCYNNKTIFGPIY